MPMFSSISVRERIKNLISGVYPILPIIYRDGFPSPLSIGFEVEAYALIWVGPFLTIEKKIISQKNI